MSRGPSLDLAAREALDAACAIPDEEGPRGFRLERAGDGQAAAVVLEAWGLTEPELLVEVARAVEALITGAGARGTPGAAEEERPVDLDAQDTASRLLGWIGLLLGWARRDGFVARDGALALRAPEGLAGAARGRRWVGLPPIPWRATDEDLVVAATCSRWIARVLLATHDP